MDIDLFEYKSPFPFLNLPAEVRNEIYKYVSAADTKPRVPKKKLNFNQDLPTPTEIHEIANRAGTSQPGLFSTCAQIRNESRGLFYRYHTFKLHIWQEEEEGLWSRFYAWLHCLQREKSCIERVKRWLDAIGPQARKEIRRLEIKIHCEDQTTVKSFARFMDEIHARLPDEATVVYRAVPEKMAKLILWELGKVFYDRDHTRGMVFQSPRWTFGDRRVMGGLNRSQGQYFPNRHDTQRVSLTFGPGMGWFNGSS